MEETDQKQKIVAVVEDDNIVRALISRTLRDEEIPHRTFGSPREALEAMRDNPDEFRMILSDGNLPEMNGPEFVQKAREINPELDAVFLSGMPIENPIFDGVSEKDYFQKPFTGNTRNEIIDRLKQKVEIPV